MITQMQWDILCSLQGSDKPLKTSQIASRVMQHHKYIDDETFRQVIRRDVNNLMRVTGAIKKEKVKNNVGELINERYAYSWSAQGTEVLAKTLSSAQAVALGVLQKIGIGMLPPGVFEELQPLFSAIHKQEIVKNQKEEGDFKKVTDKAVTSAEEKWLQKIEFMSETIGFVPQSVDPEIEKKIYDALYQEKLIEVRYRDINGLEKGTVLKPLGLVQRGARRYLIAVDRYSGGVPMRYLMSRIKQVSEVGILDFSDIKGGEDFDMEEYLKKGLAHPRFNDDELGQAIKLKLWVNEGTYSWLKETPIEEGQTAKEVNGGFEVSVITTLREELVYWILSMSNNVRVIEPKILRDRVKDDLKKSLDLYA
jgi:predicted DNA-binding transcriptional regulator YafY